jgi:ribonuclease T2
MMQYFGLKQTVKMLLAGLCYLLVHTVWAAPTGFVLRIELSPAVCKIDASQKRTRQCLEGYSLTVSGLMPEGVNDKTCETSSTPALTPVQKKVLMRIMPDENVQARLWRNVGGCVSMNASQYFRLMVNYAERLDMPSEVTTPTTIRISREGLQHKFLQLNVGMPASALQLSCDSIHRNTQPLLTNIQVCYQANGQYKTCRVEQVASSCPQQFAIQGSY